ncbi:MAG: FHA domain-containing protein, partial [Verrucomicrobiota bacterium]
MPRVTITVPDKKSQPYRFALDRKSVSLGRGSENDIVIDCGSVSVRHAVMERVKGGYRLRDLGSTNGTKIDGKARDAVELYDGAPVKLGDVAFG